MLHENALVFSQAGARYFFMYIINRENSHVCDIFIVKKKMIRSFSHNVLGCFSPPTSINGYRWIVRVVWWYVGVTHNIPSIYLLNSMETGMKIDWVGLLTQTLPDLKNKHEPRQEWRKSEVKDLEGKGLIEKLCHFKYFWYPEKEVTEEVGEESTYSFYLPPLKYFTYLTSAVITNKPFSAITIVPAGITEMHHAGSPVLAWYSIAHVRASKRWSQSVYVVGLGCTHPSLALVWGGFSIGFIIFN